MTVVVYKNGTLAADTQVVSGGAMLIGTCTKIALSACGGFMGGACGNLTNLTLYLKWIGAGADRRAWPVDLTDDFKGILVSKDGSVRYCTYKGLTIAVDAPYHAIGSGEEAAKGALVAGADATQAVMASIAVDLYCGGHAEGLSFKD